MNPNYPIITPVKDIIEHLADFEQAVRDGDLPVEAANFYAHVIAGALARVNTAIIEKENGGKL